ncbi:MAG: hypothetical protein HFP81_01600 [Methylococcales symbiont of Hymedesmia sp. n. MRB-2018]|nr:MAG: hypothetical protein HFP78_04000 [Methylococcales symbiont of Hymedesmia sp. n. MRB-2018]KAF3984553.1 MAG: hypothetical protein HFP81_01600 [Methylococcales symbiont of Hymedesmia sp. n. MRB-2018]
MKIREWMVFFILCLLAINSYAAERLYQIELVVFSQDTPNTEVFEQTESLIEWPGKVYERLAYKQVSRELMKLQGSYAVLSRQQDYQTLMHVAWIQSVKANSMSSAVQMSNAARTIDGFFRLQRGNLINMIVDIEYSPDRYQDGVVYRLNEKRRFKLNETHYLDHPKFGILARVSPIN